MIFFEENSEKNEGIFQKIMKFRKFIKIAEGSVLPNPRRIGDFGKKYKNDFNFCKDVTLTSGTSLRRIASVAPFLIHVS